jgi:uncharacterized integral membrane protein (TIGR00697 family)
MKQKFFYGFVLLAMLYMTFDLSSMVYAYKTITIGPIVGMASSIVFPFTYSIMDIVAEVYGYQTARNLIWFGMLCDFLFGSLVLLLSFLPSPSYQQYTIYHHIFSPLLRAVFAQEIGALIGAFINIYLISKWKIFLRGKYFWLRSIGSSTLGELCMLIISVLVALTGVLSFHTLFIIIGYAYLYKIIFATVISPFLVVVVKFIKWKEGIDIYDTNVNFNPLKFS